MENLNELSVHQLEQRQHELMEARRNMSSHLRLIRRAIDERSEIESIKADLDHMRSRYSKQQLEAVGIPSEESVNGQ